MKPYRLMILTATTGGGHDARADALSAWATEIYGDSVEVKVVRPLEDSKAPIGQFGVWLYNFIQLYAPFLHNIYFQVIEVIGDFQKKDFFGKGPYEKLLREFQPQMIVSVHDFLNKGYFDLAHEILGENVRCATYCGEFSGGSGFSKHWVSTQADRWIGRTEGSLREAYRLGMSPEKLECFTFFLPPDEISPISTTRRDFRLDSKKLTILFANGRNGAMDHLRYLEVLESYKDRVQAIVICGLNEKLRRDADAWQQETGFPAIIEGYSSRMRAYMQISDVVIFRGGANTACRAFHEGCPMWFETSGGIMPQERLTIDFFVKTGGAELMPSPKDLAAKIDDELKNLGRLGVLRASLRATRDKYSLPTPEQFFAEFLSWGMSPAHAEKEMEPEEKVQS